MTHPSKMPAAVKDSPNKIFVSNLPKTWDEGRMEKLFETFGKISQVNLMKNKESGDSRGFGFITFDTAEDANDAIQGMNGKDVEGVQLKVDAALKSLHSGGGGGMGDRGGRGGFRGGRGGFQRGRGGPLMRGGPMGGFPPRGGPRGGFMPRGRGGPYSRGGYGGDRDSGYDGGPPSRGMGGRGRYDGPPRGGPPRGGPRGAMRGSPRGAPRGAPRGRGGPGRPLIDRPPMEEMDQDAGYNAPRGSRPLLGKEPLLQDPGAPEFRQAREPLGHPMERPQEGYRNSQQRRPGMNPDHRQQWSSQGRNGGGYSDGGLLPTRQAQWDSAPVRREQEPLMRDREARAPPPMERLTAERPRSSFPPEREASYGGGRGGGAAASTQYGEESYGGGARGGASGRGGGGREEFGQSRGGGASSYDYQAESRPTRGAEYGAAASADPLFRSRDPYGAANSDPAPARQTRDSFMERDYAPPARSADPYAAAPSAAASRGYGAREPALPRDAPLSREAPRGRDPLPSRDYAPPARSQRDYAEPRREETVRDYARGGAGGVGGARGGYADERPAASSFASRTFEDYDKASSRGYGAASDSFGAARDPAGSTSSSRSAYASRDPYPSGRGDRAEKPGYGDPFRSAPQSSSYGGGRSAPSDRNGGGRPYSRY